MREMGLETVSDAEALGMIIEEILSSLPKEVEAYREGKGKLIGLFIGEVMKATRVRLIRRSWRPASGKG